MVYPLNSLMSREGLMQTSMIEEEERRKLERQPTTIPWYVGRMGAGAGMLGIPLLAMIAGGLATGGLGLLGGAASGGLYGLARLLKERKIIGARENRSKPELNRNVFLNKLRVLQICQLLSSLRHIVYVGEKEKKKDHYMKSPDLFSHIS